jgi:hypothetical protein
MTLCRTCHLHRQAFLVGQTVAKDTSGNRVMTAALLGMMGRGPVPPLSGHGRELRDPFVRKKAHPSRLRLDRTETPERRGRHHGSGDHLGRCLPRRTRRPRQRKRGRDATARRRRRGTRRTAAQRRRQAAAAPEAGHSVASQVRPRCAARHPAPPAFPCGRWRGRWRGAASTAARTAARTTAAGHTTDTADRTHTAHTAGTAAWRRLHLESGPTRQRGEDLHLSRRTPGHR